MAFKKQSTMERICGAWIKKSKTGNTYIKSIKFKQDVVIPAGSSLMIFKGKKEKEESPDYDILIAPDMQQGQQRPQQQRPQQQQQSYQQQTQQGWTKTQDDDIPF